MSEIEKAIKRLESCSIIPFDEDSQEVCGLAIQALREKRERDRGCKICTAGDGEFTVKCHKWNEYNFCPICGRKLGENNGH
ncbi:MAG: hypothetical protein ACQGTM_15530 [bacterium]